MIQRFRIWLAAWLCRGTPCTLARTSVVAQLVALAYEIDGYVQRSGALTDPSRIKAYRVLLPLLFWMQ